MKLNVDRLKDYKERLVVFPRKLKKPKHGDADKAAIAEAIQLTGEIAPKSINSDAVSFVEINEVLEN